eukprot:g19844.t1
MARSHTPPIARHWAPPSARPTSAQTGPSLQAAASFRPPPVAAVLGRPEAPDVAVARHRSMSGMFKWWRAAKGPFQISAQRVLADSPPAECSRRGFTTSGSFLLRPLWPSPRNVRVACRAQESNGPRMYYPDWDPERVSDPCRSHSFAQVPQEDRGTAKGGAFWGRSTEEQWGEFASGEAGSFDKDDLVEGKYPGTEDWYCAQVMKYIGQGDWSLGGSWFLQKWQLVPLLVLQWNPFLVARSPSPGCPGFLRREATSPVRWLRAPQVDEHARNALTPPPGFGNWRGRYAQRSYEVCRPNLVAQPGPLQATPSLSPQAALLAASPQLVTRSTLPPGLRVASTAPGVAVPCQAFAMSAVETSTSVFRSRWVGRGGDEAYGEQR